jgi:hypothetical protein
MASTPPMIHRISAELRPCFAGSGLRSSISGKIVARLSALSCQAPSIRNR